MELRKLLLNSSLWVGLFLLALPFVLGFSGKINLVRSIIMFVVGGILMAVFIFFRKNDGGENENIY